MDRALTAFVLLCGIFLLTFLFSRGSFDQILPGFLGLTSDQRFWLFVMALSLPSVILILLIVLDSVQIYPGFTFVRERVTH